MKAKIGFIVIASILISCETKTDKTELKQDVLPIVGTWELISGLTIEKDDSVLTDYTKNKKDIKIINETHFCFLNHDLTKGKDSASAVFSAGGGRYTLAGNKYTEMLEYCNAREWENNNFEFTVTIQNDTLIQSGIEKIEKIGINRINIEKYVRVK